MSQNLSKFRKKQVPQNWVKHKNNPLKILKEGINGTANTKQGTDRWMCFLIVCWFFFLKLVKEGISCFPTWILVFVIFGWVLVWRKTAILSSSYFSRTLTHFRPSFFRSFDVGASEAPLYILKTAYDTTTVTMHLSSGIDTVEFWTQQFLELGFKMPGLYKQS